MSEHDGSRRADSNSPKMALDTANPKITSLRRTYIPKPDPGATAQPKPSSVPVSTAPEQPPPPPPSKND
jgi:hypothetical protein